MPSIGIVTIKVYDTIGREVQTLINEEKAPGKYEIYFDGSCLPSGMYFCTMRAGNFTSTVKLALIK